MPTAAYSLILEDVKTLLSRNLPADWSIITRRDLKGFAPDLDSLPLAVVIPSQQFNEEEGFEGTLFRQYRVGVAFIQAGNQKYEDATVNPEMLASVPKCLHVTSLPTASTVFDSEMSFATTYDTRGLAMNYDYTIFDVLYSSSESRN